MKKVTSATMFIVFIATILCFVTGCSRTSIVTVSDLMNAIDVDQLSTAEFIYNGIADINKGNETFHVRYNSSVKVGISMNDVIFEVEESGKKVSIILPDITINDILVDASSISFIPTNPNIDVKDVLSACKADVENEASLTEKLIKTAEDNLRSIIQALVNPLMRDTSYSIEWYRMKTTRVKEAIG